MTELATIHNWPTLERPVLVMALEGWIDAGLTGGNAMASLLASMPHQLLADFDADELIDHRARRPVMRVVNGVHTELRWPQPVLQVATNRTGRSVLMLAGPEPDMRWHQFTNEVVQLSLRLGVQLVVGLGAFPAPVPHTRSVRLAATASNAELAGRVGFIPATIDVPSGVQASIEYAFGQAGVPAVGLWARVPHYAAAMPYPAASAALLDELSSLADIEVDTKALRAAAQTTSTQIDQLIAGSDDHAALVRQLEAQHDQEQGLSATGFGNLPSGDELAAELERFLRGEPQ
ncbi:MAG TPA: PAC2 family protein [Acidimicrobiales bacterium]|jgi:predicted ATP-grasp superfamily ATP-dependent carboligase|nr:PAC2 family protein [Acidimicrobiales bacterium]